MNVYLYESVNFFEGNIIPACKDELKECTTWNNFCSYFEMPIKFCLNETCLWYFAIEW